MSKFDLVEACRLFRNRLEESVNAADEEDERPALRFEDVDLLLRQLRIFMSMNTLWALLLEIDENVNNKIEIEEFIKMVAKLRGRSAMSPDFHLRSLPRATKDSYTKLFEVMAGEDNMIDEDDLVTASKTLHSHVNTNSGPFKQAVDDLHVADGRYGIADFLVFQAKLRKQKPEIDVAVMSLTEAEEKRFSGAFKEWREKSQSPASPQELRVILQQLGFSLSAEQCRNRLGSVELDGSRAIQLREFLYILVNLGAGSSPIQRAILLPGSSYEDAFKLGFALEELWELGYDDLSQIRRAGFSVHDVVRAAFAEPWQLRQVGYTAGELRKAGWSATQLKIAGFSMQELRNAGFSSAVLQEIGLELGRQRPESSDVSGLTLRPLTMADHGCDRFNQGEQRWWGTPRIQAMLDPSCNSESIMSLMSY